MDASFHDTLALAPDRSWRPPARFGGDATGVAAAPDGTLIVFGRGPSPVVVLDASGSVVDEWGQGEFDNPHSLALDDAGDLFLVDSGGHFVDKRTIDGNLIFRLGSRGEASAPHGGIPFNRPSGVAVDPQSGDIFVTDGYLNSAVHRFDNEGRHIRSWGRPGAGRGEFSLPHGVAVVAPDRIAVCDRENFRIQVFSMDGDYITQFHSHHPADVVLYGHWLAVAELGPPWYQAKTPNLGNRVAFFDLDGNRVGAVGAALPSAEADAFIAPHGLAVGPDGTLYVAEVSRTWITQMLKKEDPGAAVPCLRAWTTTARSAVGEANDD